MILLQNIYSNYDFFPVSKTFKSKLSVVNRALNLLLWTYFRHRKKNTKQDELKLLNVA